MPCVIWYLVVAGRRATSRRRSRILPQFSNLGAWILHSHSQPRHTSSPVFVPPSLASLCALTYLSPRSRPRLYSSRPDFKITRSYTNPRIGRPRSAASSLNTSNSQLETWRVGRFPLVLMCMTSGFTALPLCPRRSRRSADLSPPKASLMQNCPSNLPHGFHMQYPLNKRRRDAARKYF